jgi:hypothetical protein
MLISNIVNGVNTKLAGETMTFNQLKLFLSETIDDINRELCATYPSFDDLKESDNYNYFPDKYIRSVVITGAAYKFYETDEEGIVTATQYHYDYLDNLFYMKRDYSCSVPPEYQDTERGYVTGPELRTGVTLGMTGWC